jgi:hypothetical protein
MTFAVLSTFNRTLFFRRHRRSQTLVVSPLLTVRKAGEKENSPPYLPLAMVGMIAGGFRDLNERIKEDTPREAKRIKLEGSGHKKLPDLWNGKDELSPKSRKKDSIQGSSKQKAC